MVPDLDEGELVRRAQAGDRSAIEVLLDRHLPGLTAFVHLRIGQSLGPREGVSDVVQSTCRDLLERIEDFRHGGEMAFRHWLYATAARKIADRYAHHAAEKRDLRREVTPEAVSGALRTAFADLASPSQQAIGAEFLERLQVAFAELTDDEREVVLLSRVVSLTRAEVAKAMGRSENGVRNLLHRTLITLSERLDTGA